MPILNQVPHIGTVGELIEALKIYPPQARLVFEDQAEEEGSFENIEVEFTGDGEVVIRTV